MTGRVALGAVGVLAMSPAPLDVPRLRCPPLVLRAFTAEDALLVVEASRDPCITATTTVPEDPGPREVQAFLDRQHERARSGQGWSLAIADIVTDQGLGQIGLWPHGQGRASVGCWVLPTARRRGIATTALSCLSVWGLGQPGTTRLELYVEPGDEGSLRAAAAAGYQQEALLHGHREIDGRRRDMLLLTRTDHLSGHGAPRPCEAVTVPGSRSPASS